jgi:hypothetical protein
MWQILRVYSVASKTHIPADSSNSDSLSPTSQADGDFRSRFDRLVETDGAAFEVPRPAVSQSRESYALTTRQKWTEVNLVVLYGRESTLVGNDDRLLILVAEEARWTINRRHHDLSCNCMRDPGARARPDSARPRVASG